MLNKGIRDEKKVRADKMLSSLLSFVFFPKFWNVEDTSLLDNELIDFGLTIQRLIDLTELDLINHLRSFDFDWDHLEQFADFLVQISKGSRFDFYNKAIAIYHYIQTENKTFSFDVYNKIALTKAKSLAK
jgi:hypothetical protein